MANNDWYNHYENELDTLPVPGLDPSDLRMALEKSGGFQSFMDQNPELVLKLKIYNIQNEDDLLRIQEISYRSLPHESYADNFACNLLRKYWGSIGLNSDLLKNLPTRTP